MNTTYENCKIIVSEEISERTGKPYIKVICRRTDKNGKNVDVLIGFDKLAKDLYFVYNR